MPKNKVAIVGASGTLGSMVLDVLARDPAFELLATVRDERLIGKAKAAFPSVEWGILDAERDSVAAIEQAINGVSWVINCIGKTKPYIHDDNPEEIERALRVNALFPHHLAYAAANRGARIIQIATDCVYSGAEGDYVEQSKHDALDVYGKTKSLGECLLPTAMHLRCSIIGPEPKLFVSLLEWFRGQPDGAELTGFSNHYWNGVTTYQFARLCQGIIQHDRFAPGVQHVVPDGTISKADLLECFKSEFRRPDISIKHVEVHPAVNRTLNSQRQELNRSLWESAGYDTAPTVPEMVAEIARYDYRCQGAFD